MHNCETVDITTGTGLTNLLEGKPVNEFIKKLGIAFELSKDGTKYVLSNTAKTWKNGATIEKYNKIGKIISKHRFYGFYKPGGAK